MKMIDVVTIAITKQGEKGRDITMSYDRDTLNREIKEWLRRGYALEIVGWSLGARTEGSQRPNTSPESH
jgi:hypothetical protein